MPELVVDDFDALEEPELRHFLASSGRQFSNSWNRCSSCGSMCASCSSSSLGPTQKVDPAANDESMKRI